MGKKRRAFSLEFKSEAVRRLGERRLHGGTVAQVGRELGVRPDILERWERQLGGQDPERGPRGRGSRGGGSSATPGERRAPPGERLCKKSVGRLKRSTQHPR